MATFIRSGADLDAILARHRTDDPRCTLCGQLIADDTYATLDGEPFHMGCVDAPVEITEADDIEPLDFVFEPEDALPKGAC
jgi:hypothetical protein